MIHRARAQHVTFGLGCLWAALIVGCGPKEPYADGPPPRQKMEIPRLSVEDIGKNAYGPALHSAKLQGNVAEYAYIPKLDDTPQKNLNRMVQLGALSVVSTLRDHPGVRKIRLTAVDPADTAKPLLVWVLPRKASEKIDWSHGATAENLLAVADIEHSAPAFQALIPAKGGSQNVPKR